MTYILWFAALAAWFIYIFKALRRHLHMMQQNGYRNDRYLRWLKPRLRYNFFLRDLLPLVPGAVLLGNHNMLFMVLLLISYIILFLAFRLPSAKKKLVFTARAKRLFAVALALTIILAALPAAVLGAGFGHYMWALIILVAGSFASALIMLLANYLIGPWEKHINNNFLQDAKRILQEMPYLQKVAVTGSYGKTSTKVIIGRILGEKFNVLVTPDSYNTPMGITITIRQMLKASCEVFVTEMGARQKGDIAELCGLVEPNIGIITAIGPQHLETFGSLEQVAATKLELAESLPSDGLLVLNYDDPILRNSAGKTAARVVSYALANDKADYKAKNIVFSQHGTSFILQTKNGKEQLVETGLLGRHNVSNILAAAALACEMGVTPHTVAKAACRLTPVKYRLELKETPAGIIVINDAFNSNPAGFAAALEVLQQMELQGKKIIVTPGMVELGAVEDEKNAEAALKAAHVCDYVILVGREHTLSMQEALKKNGVSPEKYFVAANLTDANRHLAGIVKKGDCVLYENDLPDTYNER